MIKPRQAGRTAPARGKPSAGAMKPSKGKGSYKRAKYRLTDERLIRETGLRASLNQHQPQEGNIMFTKSTGLGIKSTNPRHWQPNPSRAVIMTPQRFAAFMASGQPAPQRTPNVPAGSCRQGRILPAKVPY